MTFSIIISAYNEEKYIIPCLRSVFSQKEAPDYEVIVVDNASQDRTAKIVRDNFPRARVVQESRKGVTIARNRGAKEAKGEILLFLDADVIIPSNHLRKIEGRFGAAKKLITVSGPYIYFDGGFRIRLATFVCYQILAFPAEYFFNRLLNFGCGINAGNFAVYRTIFEKIGGFDEKITFYGDETDISRRLKKFGKVRFFRDLEVKSSARRLKKEGAVRSYFKYALNFVWPYLFSQPLTKKYIDIR